MQVTAGMAKVSACRMDREITEFNTRKCSVCVIRAFQPLNSSVVRASHKRKGNIGGKCQIYGIGSSVCINAMCQATTICLIATSVSYRRGRAYSKTVYGETGH